MNQPPIEIYDAANVEFKRAVLVKYEELLIAAQQAGETCSCLDVPYLMELLRATLQDIKFQYPTPTLTKVREALELCDDFLMRVWPKSVTSKVVKEALTLLPISTDEQKENQ